jgi:hypothetical protein
MEVNITCNVPVCKFCEHTPECQIAGSMQANLVVGKGYEAPTTEAVKQMAEQCWAAVGGVQVMLEGCGAGLEAPHQGFSMQAVVGKAAVRGPLEGHQPHPGMEAVDVTAGSVPDYKMVVRRDDMSNCAKLVVHRQPDGDMLVTVIDERGHIAGVEFCSVGMGGGRSPKTLEALRALQHAMAEDYRRRPIEGDEVEVYLKR